MTMTDKTSTAPVMSLREVRDLLEGAQISGNLSRVSLHVTRVRQAIRSLDHHLNAPTPDVVGGDVLAHSCFMLDGVSVSIHGDESSIDRVMDRINKTSDRLGNFLIDQDATRAQGDTEMADDVVAWRYRIKSPNTGAFGEWFLSQEKPADSPFIEYQPLATQPKGDGSHTDLITFLEELRERYAASEDECACDFVTRTIRALSAMPAQEAAHPAEQTSGNGCPCEPHGLDGLSCPGPDGRLLCDPAQAEGTQPAKASRSEALSQILAFADELSARDARSDAAYWQAEYDALMARKPGQTSGDEPDVNDEPYACGHDNGLKVGAERFASWIIKNHPYTTPCNKDSNSEFAIIRWLREYGEHFPHLVLDAPRQAVPDELIADLRKFHEETEACDEFYLSNEATAALLAANLIEGTHFVLTAKGEALLTAPSAGRMGVES